MTSFEDVYRILDAGSDANIAPYQHMPRLNGEAEIGDSIASLGLASMYNQEMVTAKANAHLGALDMLIGVKGVIAGAILEVLQTEQQDAIRAGEKPYDFWLSRLAAAPVDWKAVATAGVAFAATSGARRASRPYTVGRDVEKVMKQAATADGFIPHTQSSFKHFRRTRRMREAGITIAATGTAYEVGTVLNPIQNVLLGAGLAAAMTARTIKAEVEHKRRGF